MTSLRVWDTSAVFDAVESSQARWSRLSSRLSAGGRDYVHPVTLAEVAELTHSEVVAQRRPHLLPDAVTSTTARAKHLQSMFASHTVIDRGRLQKNQMLNGSIHYRFVRVTEASYAPMIMWKLRADLVRDVGGMRTALQPMTDCTILAAAFHLAEQVRSKGDSVILISSDHALLNAACHLGLAWIDTKHPDNAGKRVFP